MAPRLEANKQDYLEAYVDAKIMCNLRCWCFHRESLPILPWMGLGPTVLTKWVCLKIVYPYTQWLMIIIPMKNGYFIGNIPNIFRQTQITPGTPQVIQELQLRSCRNRCYRPPIFSQLTPVKKKWYRWIQKKLKSFSAIIQNFDYPWWYGFQHIPTTWWLIPRLVSGLVHPSYKWINPTKIPCKSLGF